MSLDTRKSLHLKPWAIPTVHESYVPVSDQPGYKTPNTTHDSHAWEAGVWVRLPSFGITYLFTAVIAIIGCIVVLLSSHGQHVDVWPAPGYTASPTVILAILSALTNFSLRATLWEGLNYTWWTAVIRGTTLGRLHRYWDQGTSIYSVLLAPQRMTWIGFATLAVSVVVIDGPLLQRASTTRMTTESHNETLVNVTIATHLPYGQTGFMMWTDTGPIRLGGTLLNHDFSRILEDYNYRRHIIANGISGCKGTCKGSIYAAGLYRDCSEEESQRVWVAKDERERLLSFPGTAFSTTVGWSHYDRLMSLRTDPPQSLGEGFDRIDPDEPFIWLNVTYAKNTNPSSTNKTFLSVSDMIHKNCKLYSATREYSVKVHNDTIAASTTKTQDRGETFLKDDKWGDMKLTTLNTISLSEGSKPAINTFQSQRRDVAPILTNLGYTNLSDVWFMNGIGLFRGPNDVKENNRAFPVYDTLSGISTAVQGLVGSTVTFEEYNPSELGLFVKMDGSMATQMLKPQSVGHDGFFGMEWTDPTDIILSMLDELMFRCAIAAAFNNTLERITFNTHINGTLEMFPQSQVVAMNRDETILVYESHYLYLGLSIAVMLLAVIVVIPTLDWFWTLGRRTSMNPIETALAFGAPALDDMPSNANERGLLKRGETKNVQYGVDTLSVRSSWQDRRLILTSASRVKPPVSGINYY